MLLLSMHASPITNGDAMSYFVPCHNGRERPLILTSPILIKYTTKMRGVDVADQLCGNYFWLSR